jgi:hypothetical protein
MAEEEVEDIDIPFSTDMDDVKDPPPAAETAPSTKAGKERGKGKGKFGLVFDKNKKINAPPAPKSTDKPKDPKKSDSKGVGAKVVAKDFVAGVILQSPVGMAPIFTSMLPNVGFLASTINEAKASCQKPETGNIHPFLGMCYDMMAFAVRRAFCLKDEGITPLRGFPVSPQYEGLCYAECETLKGSVFCTNVNSALILRSIGTYTDKFADDARG